VFLARALAARRICYHLVDLAGVDTNRSHHTLEVFEVALAGQFAPQCTPDGDPQSTRLLLDSMFDCRSFPNSDDSRKVSTEPI